MAVRAKKPKKNIAARRKVVPQSSEGQIDPSGQALLHVSKREEAKSVQIKYVVPLELQMQYADNLNVTHTETEFVISFIQMQHPLVVSNEDWGDVDTILGKCVARLIVHPSKMPLFIKALENNFNQFYANTKARIDELQAAEAAENK
jgi:ethanolamine utilization protein EutA (predicted chaperonin)